MPVWLSQLPRSLRWMPPPAPPHGRTPSTFTWPPTCECAANTFLVAYTSVVVPRLKLSASSHAQGLSGWPKLHFQVWSRQKAGRAKIRELKHPGRGFHLLNNVKEPSSVSSRLPAPGGYGFCHVPTMAGVHKVSCSTWVPQVRSQSTRLWPDHSFACWQHTSSPRLRLNMFCGAATAIT